MLLSDRDLIAEVKDGTLQLDPFEPALIQPSSIDVRLDRLFRVFNNHLYTHIDPATQQDELTSEVDVPDGQPFVLHPGEFVLASTLEVITLGDRLAGRLEGKSSLGRLGLLTHSTAGFIDPGFSGHVTLELSNVANLRPGDLVFYFSDLHHVGMYVGDGWIVHAPRANDVVRMQRMDRMSIHSYGRPAP